VTATRFFVS